MKAADREKLELKQNKFINSMKSLSPKSQYIVLGVLKDLLHINKLPKQYHKFLVKERLDCYEAK